MTGRTRHARDAGCIEVHQAGDHFEGRTLLKAALQSGGQLLETGHGDWTAIH